MAYEPKPMGHRLGIWAEKFEQKRIQMGLDTKGFPITREERDTETEEVNDGTITR